MRHNEITKEIAEITRMANPQVYFEPYTNKNKHTQQTHTVRGGGGGGVGGRGGGEEEGGMGKDERDGNERRGDTLVRGFFSRQTDCVTDTKVVDPDAPSYVKKYCHVSTLLAAVEKENNNQTQTRLSR